MRKRQDLQELVAEVVRRGHGDELIHLSVPPTASEQLQLLAAQLQGAPFVIWPKSWEMLEEWLDYYSKVFAVVDHQTSVTKRGGITHESIAESP